MKKDQLNSARHQDDRYLEGQTCSPKASKTQGSLLDGFSEFQAEADMYQNVFRM